uniref:Peptidase S1 domain-containing protein n=1 Tax=Ciona savignyi TaxID=51511 RepID=H2YJT8_CIOSA
LNIFTFPDPCTLTNGGCDHLCNWTAGVATCSCHIGFRLQADNKTCEDINECTDGPNPCFLALPAYCVNNIGSFSCQPYVCNATGTMNYYRSGTCCKIRNGSCGTTGSIRSKFEQTQLSPTSRRVLGGVSSALSAWPWMAQITYRGLPHCGATLISDRWLVCAAHCFRSVSYAGLVVHLGIIRSAHLTGLDTSRRIRRNIGRVISHPNFTSAYMNDIALIQLSHPVVFNDIINPICLPCGETPNPGTKCWVTGFGRTESSGYDSSRTLREVDVPVVNTTRCVEAYRGVHHVDGERMVCAGYEEGRKDACNGDSGGPLACQREDSCDWYISGVTSFGRGCGLPGYFGVYTNVVHYEGWIREQLGNDSNGLCPRRYNVCKKLVDLRDNCQSMLDHCDNFPQYMGVNCARSCCQLKHGEIKNCANAPDSEEACELYAAHCTNPAVSSFMRQKCRRTCGFC